MREAFAAGNMTQAEYDRYRVRTPGRFLRVGDAEMWEREDGTADLERLEAVLEELETETVRIYIYIYQQN